MPPHRKADVPTSNGDAGQAAPRKRPSKRAPRADDEGAGGVCWPSCSTGECPLVLHEGAAEGPRRIIFDLETISQHEKAAGAKSEGLTFGPCSDYNGSRPVLLCDLEIVFLVLMRLRTSEVRELQAAVSHQGLVVMGGNAAVATAMANHWKAEREAKNQEGRR